MFSVSSAKARELICLWYEGLGEDVLVFEGVGSVGFVYMDLFFGRVFPLLVGRLGDEREVMTRLPYRIWNLSFCFHGVGLWTDPIFL